MSYLLDTNVCIKYINGTNQKVSNRFQSNRRDQIFLCDIVKFELYYGAYKSFNTSKNLESLAVFFDEFISLPFDSKAAEICGFIRANLAKQGRPIGVYDLQIAAIAHTNNLVLVTHNISEFSRVKGLQYEDWEI